MVQSLVARVLEKISEARELYYHLLLIVGPTGSGKTRVLQEVSVLTSAALVNVNLELSRRMLDLTEQERALQARKLLGEIVNKTGGENILLDNTEIIFDVRLKQNPLRLLQGLSRNKTIVASWNGSITDSYITYAVPGHPEYQHCHIRDFLVVDSEVAT